MDTNQQEVKDENIQEETVVAPDADVWKEKYIRVLADYQNLERRMQTQIQDIRMFAGQGVVEKLLPVVDLLEKAQEHLQDQGLALALKELEVFFRSVGVEKIDVAGKEFNPYEMDCVEIVEGKHENCVVGVLSHGYRMHGKVIRPAKVTVGKKGEKDNVKNGNKE